MSPTTLRIIIGLVLLVHGIGHIMAFFPAFNINSTDKWHHRSWLLTPLIGDTASRVISIILFGAAFIGFIECFFGYRIFKTKFDISDMDESNVAKIAKDKIINKGGMRTGIIINLTN